MPTEQVPGPVTNPAKRFATYRVNFSGLRAHVAAHNAVAWGSKYAVVLPLPGGRFVDILLTPTGVLTPNTQAGSPEI